MKRFQRFYVIYGILVVVSFLFLIWFLPTQPLLTTLWLGIHLLFLTVISPQFLKLPKLTLTPPPLKILPLGSEELRLKTIFANLDQLVLVVDSDGKILQKTPAWYPLFNIQEGMAFTMDSLQKSPKLWSAINQSLATEKGAEFQWELGEKTFQSSIAPLFIQQEFDSVLLTAVDITKVSQLEKIQSDFLADISHEIKTPVATILGASEILNQTQRKLTAEETKDFQAMIASESSRLQRLINELTDLSKIGTRGFQTLIKSKCSLLELLSSVQKTHQLSLNEKNLTLRIDVPSSLKIFVDYDKFFLIFSNLLSNAIRYTDQGEILIRSEVKNNNLIIYFSDSGRGIEPKNIDRIFDRFYRTDSARNRVGGGTGLGLAITRAIVQAHQGTIAVRSQLGKGTTFTLTIPHLT